MKILQLFAIALLSTSGCLAQLTEPGGRPEDTLLAATNPDEYAWKLFLFLNHQASKTDIGVADPSKKAIIEYDDNTDVVWETWATATGGEGGLNKSEVFKNPAVDPGPWEELARKRLKGDKPLGTPFKSTPLFLGDGALLRFSTMREMDPHTPGAVRPFFVPFPQLADSDETRMNRVMYETIRKHHLYSIEGIEAKYKDVSATNQQSSIKSHLLVDFDRSAKEVKARWEELKNPNDKSRYHWKTLSIKKADGATVEKTYGLVALHIITKDLQNWFWSDFGHIDKEPLADTPLIDRTTLKTDGVRPETKGSKWEFYRLRGTQIDFIDSLGKATILSNPVIESADQNSSCITCHARAATAPLSVGVPALSKGTHIAGKGALTPGASFTDVGPPGATDNSKDGLDPRLLQMDFVWSILFRAFNEK